MKNPVKFRSLFGGAGSRSQSRKNVNQDYPPLNNWAEAPSGGGGVGDVIVRPVLNPDHVHVRQRSNTLSETDVQCRKEIVKIIQTPKLQR